MSKIKCLECGAEVDHVCLPVVPDDIPLGVDIRITDRRGYKAWLVVIQHDRVSHLMFDIDGTNNYVEVDKNAHMSPAELVRAYLRRSGSTFDRVCNREGGE